MKDQEEECTIDFFSHVESFASDEELSSFFGPPEIRGLLRDGFNTGGNRGLLV